METRTFSEGQRAAALHLLVSGGASIWWLIWYVDSPKPKEYLPVLSLRPVGFGNSCVSSWMYKYCTCSYICILENLPWLITVYNLQFLATKVINLFWAKIIIQNKKVKCKSKSSGNYHMEYVWYSIGSNLLINFQSNECISACVHTSVTQWW